jgi:hypothetical protein
MNTLRAFAWCAITLATVYTETPAVAQTAPPGITLRPQATTGPTPSSAPTQATPAPVSAEALQAAKDLVAMVSVSMLSDLTNKMTAQVWPSVEAVLRAQNPKVDAATLMELRGEFQRQILDNVAEAMKDAPTIYGRYFTAQEMRDLAAFYRTPVGAKTLQAMPQITADLNGLMLARMQSLQERVNLAFLNVLQKHGLYAK